MSARPGRRLRVASICLLVVAAALSLSASVPIKPARAQSPALAAAQPGPHTYDSAIAVVPASGRPSAASGRTCFHSGLATPCSSVGHSTVRRTFIFVEDTTPPSSEALKNARLQHPVQAHAPPLPASPPLRGNFTSPSNRQRAP